MITSAVRTSVHIGYPCQLRRLLRPWYGRDMPWALLLFD